MTTRLFYCFVIIIAVFGVVPAFGQGLCCTPIKSHCVSPHYHCWKESPTVGSCLDLYGRAATIEWPPDKSAIDIHYVSDNSVYFCGAGLLMFNIDEFSGKSTAPTSVSTLNEAIGVVREAISVVDAHFCTDEYEQAFADTTANGSITDTAVPALWDGAPFVVDVSSTFPNAYELLDVVAEEAERVRMIVGYDVFVAGEVLPLPNLTKADLAYNSDGSHHLPPDQHIEIRCCYGEGISSAGTAAALLRIVLLENDNFQSRHIITHELYHLLGFTHPGNSVGVVMSDSLMYGPGHTPFGASIRTQPTLLDLAQLACIYDNISRSSGNPELVNGSATTRTHASDFDMTQQTPTCEPPLELVEVLYSRDFPETVGTFICQ